MKNIIRLSMFVCVVGVSLITSGCLSAWSYKCSEDEIVRTRVYASGDSKTIDMLNRGVDAKTAIRAIPLSNGGVGIGVDVTSLDALTQHPVRQIGAAIGDAALLYGAYQAYDKNLGSGSKDNGDKNTTVNVNGDGNTTTTTSN